VCFFNWESPPSQTVNPNQETDMLSNGQIQKFQALYRNRFGREISSEEAYESGAKLMRLVELIYKPMTQEEYGGLKKRRKETEVYD